MPVRDQCGSKLCRTPRASPPLKMKKTIVWPTERHQQLGEHILNVCSANGLGLLLKGSLATGIARPFSDIDVSIYGGIDRKNIDEILFGFETPLMINGSEIPPGLLIVAYRRGLALDIGFKGNESVDETGDSLLLKPSQCEAMSDLAKIYLQTIGRTDEYSKIIKLLHKGLLKYLNGKYDAAGNFIEEIAEFTGAKIENQQNMMESFQAFVAAFLRKDDSMASEFSWLLEQAAKEDTPYFA
jgi:hypothetical protein